MAARICRIFPGHTFADCFEMTRNQLKLFFYETFRQEARYKLTEINIIRLANAGDAAKQAIENIEYQAYPPDPEADGHMDKERLKTAFSKFKKWGIM
jgi:hypothetical protein